MKLSIITINYNNASGLQKTMESVLAQISRNFEYIVVDGTPQPPKGGISADNEVRDGYIQDKFIPENGFTRCTWLSTSGEISGGFFSEPDSGIYNAMNKGIRMAKGEYVQFLNSGDILAANNVTERMLQDMLDCEILYGNMLKPYKGKVLRDKGFAGRKPTMLDFYKGTLNHSTAYIKRSLFENFGFYDETLCIVSDWKWYLQVIALNYVVPVYRDIDVTVFDMTGISSVNSTLDKTERREVLERCLPLSVLADYDQQANQIDQITRINKFGLTRKLFWLVERVLFKWEKYKI